jgi:hypothetical protein
VAISKDNSALRRFLGWIAEGDLEVVSGAPTMRHRSS